MKKLLIAAAFGAAGLMSTAATAATTTDTFDVIIDLTAACQISSLPDVNLTYTSFQVGASTGSTTAAIRCTNTLSYNLSLDTLAVADAILGLNYTLSFPGGTGAFAGTGVDANHQIDVSIAGGQGGTCAAVPPATCNNGGVGNNRTRTLTVTF